MPCTHSGRVKYRQYTYTCTDLLATKYVLDSLFAFSESLTWNVHVRQFLQPPRRTWWFEPVGRLGTSCLQAEGWLDNHDMCDLKLCNAGWGGRGYDGRNDWNAKQILDQKLFRPGSHYISCDKWDFLNCCCMSKFHFLSGAVHRRGEAGEQWWGVPRGVDVLWAVAVLRHRCVWRTGDRGMWLIE